jgi:hypothetical protein
MFQYVNKLSKDFNEMIKKIDLNIKDLNLNKSDKNLLNETNNLISNASLILVKLYENSNNYPIKDLENKFKILENKKKEITNISNKLQINLLNKVENSKNEEMETLLEHDEQPIDVNYLTNYNEALLDGTLKNLREINSNLQDTAISLKNQGEQLKLSSQKMDINSQQVKEGSKLLNEINCSSMCNKIWMFIVNILLFVIILLLIMLKLLSY